MARPEEIDDQPSGFLRIVQKVVDVRASEVRALFLGFVYYFLILSSYYVIRPIRDDFGSADFENLTVIFTGTLVVMLIANALFAALVARLSRRRFIPITYRFFIANLLLFFVLLYFIPKQQVWVGRAFFVWTSVFNLFVLSVFWAFMVDVFNSEQGKRLFGFVSVGGTLGAIVGAAITASLVQKIGSLKLLLVSAVLIELSARCVRFFPATSGASAAPSTKDPLTESPVGGGIWAGVVHNFSSPYLLGISAYMLLYALTSTLLYFQQSAIARAAFSDRAARTAFFAKIDLAVNILTVLVQLFLTGRLLKWLGVAFTLAVLPALSVLGFTTLGMASTVVVLVMFLTLRRATNFAVARPTRETLFTVMSREDKYKSKNFIDTVVYRTGDQIGAWTDRLLRSLGLGLAGVSLIAVPIAAVWLFISLWLGRRQRVMSEDKPGST
jgi:AAA family ATP:ADP antiporter